MTANARFWMYWHGSPVKLTVKPWKAIGFHHTYFNGEGYSQDAEIIRHMGDHLIREITHRGRDCDGEHATYQDLYCMVNDLNANEPWNPNEDQTLRFPEWHQQSSEVYDQFARAAGY